MTGLTLVSHSLLLRRIRVIIDDHILTFIYMRIITVMSKGTGLLIDK
jgi:hypothetical protein